MSATPDDPSANTGAESDFEAEFSPEAVAERAVLNAQAAQDEYLANADDTLAEADQVTAEAEDALGDDGDNV